MFTPASVVALNALSIAFCMRSRARLKRAAHLLEEASMPTRSQYRCMECLATFPRQEHWRCPVCASTQIVMIHDDETEGSNT